MRQPSTTIYYVTMVVLIPLLLFAVLLCGEVGLRVYLWTRDGIPPDEWARFYMGNLGASTLDEALGWRATENYHAKRHEKTLAGQRYQVELSQEAHGFRRFGEVGSVRPKVLVIGDSLTHAREVSDSHTYYSILGAELDLEIFAYGVEGYGTLQEYIILDRYIDLIRPDLIVWQYCFNDLINNSPELESASALHNNARPRPYLINGVVTMLFPKQSLIPLRWFALRYSRLLHFLLGRMDKFMAMYGRNIVELEIETQGVEHSEFSLAREVTRQLVLKVRQRTMPIPVVAFNCQSVEPYNQVLRDISSEQGILFLDAIAQAVDFSFRKGEDVYHSDGAHWNERGHRVVGEALVKEFRSLFYGGASRSVLQH